MDELDDLFGSPGSSRRIEAWKLVTRKKPRAATISEPNS
jgi:hypothetical protein